MWLIYIAIFHYDWVGLCKWRYRLIYLELAIEAETISYEAYTLLLAKSCRAKMCQQEVIAKLNSWQTRSDTGLY